MSNAGAGGESETNDARRSVEVAVIVIEGLDSIYDVLGKADRGEGKEDEGTTDAREGGDEIEEQDCCFAVGVARVFNCFCFYPKDII